MRRKDHPSFPSAITCCFLSLLKTLLMPREPIRAPSGVNVPGFPMAGFQLTLYGRIWVTPEAQPTILFFVWHGAGILGQGKNDGIEYAAACRIARKRRCDHSVGDKNAIAQPKGGTPEYTHDKEAEPPPQPRFHHCVGHEKGHDNEEHAWVGEAGESLTGIRRAGKHR